MRNQSRYKLHLYHFKLLWGIATSQVEAPYNNKPVYQRWDLLLVVFLLGRNYAKPSSRHFCVTMAAHISCRVVTPNDYSAKAGKIETL